MTASSGEYAVRCRGIADGVKHSMPAQIIVEITSGHAVEAHHPAFPSAVIRVDVLHMERGTSHADALSKIDRLMRHAAMWGVALVNRRAIGTQDGFAFQTMADRVIDGLMIDRLQRIGQRMAFAIAHDQYPDFVVGVAAFAGFLRPAATLAWRAFERSRALVRSTHERLIRLGDTRQALRLHSRRRGQKPMPPAKGR